VKKVEKITLLRGHEHNETTLGDWWAQDIPIYEEVLLCLPDLIAAGKRQACTMAIRPKSRNGDATTLVRLRPVVERLYNECMQRYFKKTCEDGSTPSPLSLFAFPLEYDLLGSKEGPQGELIYALLWIGKGKPGDNILGVVLSLLPDWVKSEFEIIGADDVLFKLIDLPEMLLEASEHGLCDSKAILQFGEDPLRDEPANEPQTIVHECSAGLQ